MVTVGTGGSGTRFIKTDYPVTDGLTAGTQKQTGRQENLVAEEEDLIPERLREGL